ncbi:hypothetical protein AMTR_s00044p00113880 [Amborella trichopoda]|uniref:Myb/SANT-like domain-containing protein n=1 Tax=Amborella trichopoda TaxID=13333 RepID=U5D9R7_AMBTC|nr:hypothetical protein AMTR_s00044p00113880 [Amborella trichopoda]
MLKEVKSRNGGFKKNALNRMVEIMMAKFGYFYDAEGLRSKHIVFRTLYRNFKKLIIVSGFGWDDERKMVTTEADIWDDYIVDNVWGKKYRNKSLPDITRLKLTFCNRVADGARSSGGGDVGKM